MFPSHDFSRVIPALGGGRQAHTQSSVIVQRKESNHPLLRSSFFTLWETAKQHSQVHHHLQRSKFNVLVLFYPFYFMYYLFVVIFYFALCLFRLVFLFFFFFSVGGGGDGGSGASFYLARSSLGGGDKPEWLRHRPESGTLHP